MSSFLLIFRRLVNLKAHLVILILIYCVLCAYVVIQLKVLFTD